MRGAPPRLAIIVAAGFALLLLGRVFWTPSDPRRGMRPPEPEPPADAPARAAPSAATRPVPAGATAPLEEADGDPIADMDASAQAWAAVDLDEMRTMMPDNLYWTMGFPTKDPAVLEQREAERARWNTEYGKVLSNTATPEEIDAYYAERERLSRDYAAFAGFLLMKYSDKLPKRDAALLKLSVELHLARLQEIPRQVLEAHERRKKQEAIRQAWLEEQKGFEGGPPGPAAGR